MKFLCAEDNELNAEIAETLLCDEGAAVTIVHDGKEALDLFLSQPAHMFDAILMDMMMPNMDGITATKEIRAASVMRPDAGQIPIIAMTANAFDEDRKRSREAGMNGHLAKPLNIQDIIGTIAECIQCTSS